MKKALLALSVVASFSAYAKQPTLLDELSRLFQPPEVKAPSDASTAISQPTDFRSCSQFFAGGISPVVPNMQQLKPRELCYDAFAVLHSGLAKTPVFVAERLSRAQLENDKSGKRTDKFFADARIPRGERAELDDYKHSGYSRGHMAPAGNMPTVQAMAQSFSLANMVPQAPENNQKSWNGIEQTTRKYALRAKGDVYVISGPVYDGKPKTIGDNRVWVPTYLYKLVYDATTGRAWAHWIENSDDARAGKPISYEELVRRTNIEFLPKVEVTGPASE
ncbi:DNA/RNA non-specific endonuclease [Noviherbaspirillum sp. Root189]|uniref:DNA/RNA non-specific endonuclease n=1 Tax=Noviherbaspirillum sp. Root189 TaxID=1736487 RepID=UPI0009EB1C52|nr:DNA/RNA non-specific endonuclease [Noviherbaspirillum sp. Root189]